MNLLLVANYQSDVGYAWRMMEQFWISLARANPKRKTYLCFPTITTVNPELVAAGIEIIEFAFDLSKPRELARFIQDHQIEHLYLSDRPAYSWVYLWLRLAGVRSITMHDHTPGVRTVPKGFKRSVKALAARLMGCDAYIATSSYVLRRHKEVVRAPANRCHLARNGIVPHAIARRDSGIRAELGLSPDTLLIVSCSRATRYKRIHHIIEAAALVRALAPEIPVCFVHLGDGPDLAFFQQCIEERGLEDCFRLLGNRSDVPQILAGCDIAVHASEGEVGLCLAILEFMSAGLPCVVTDEPSVCGCIRDGETGLLFRRENCVDLAGELIRLMKDPALRDRLGSAARQEANTNYNLRDTIAAVVRIVNHAGAERRAGIIRRWRLHRLREMRRLRNPDERLKELENTAA